MNRLHTEVRESVCGGFKALLLITTQTVQPSAFIASLLLSDSTFVFLYRTTRQRRRLILLTSATFLLDTCKQ